MDARWHTDNGRRGFSAAVRQAALRRDVYRCERCGARHRLEFHHRRRSDPSLFNCHHVKWDCFVWLTDLNCGKVSPLLRSLLDLNNDTRRTLRSKRCPGSGTPFSTRGCGGPMNELVANARTTQLAGAPVWILERTNLARLKMPCNFFSTISL